MVLLLAKNSEAGCLFRPNFLKQVVIEIQKMEHPRQKFSKYPLPRALYKAYALLKKSCPFPTHHSETNVLNKEYLDCQNGKLKKRK